MQRYLASKYKSMQNYDFPPKKVSGEQCSHKNNFFLTPILAMQVIGRFADDVVEYRRRELEKWLQYCFDCNEVLRDPSFQQFLNLTVSVCVYNTVTPKYS